MRQIRDRADDCLIDVLVGNVQCKSPINLERVDGKSLEISQ